MDIVIIGTGYVGLVTGACFAEMGHTVICLDIDEKKIASLKNGVLPIYEPGLAELVERNTKEGRLFFTTDYAVVENSSICFIAVPTPATQEGSCDLSYVKNAAKEVGRRMKGEMIVVNKSTVPVGTADLVYECIQNELQKRGVAFTFDVVSNPEFLKEGAAIQDCLKPDRIIIGSNSERATALLQKIYAPFQFNNNRMYFMDPRSAEMTKYAANAMLATRISFMNEIAGICSKVGADVNKVRLGIGSDSRIGSSFLYPGVGYGGSCFPKDVKALIAMADEVQASSLILKATEEVNSRQKMFLAQKISKYFEKLGGVKGKTVAIWGLSFKPDTDDIREAPSIVLINWLLEQGASLRLFDPIAIPNMRKLVQEKMIQENSCITWCKDPVDAAANADAIALVTEWKQFRGIDLETIKKHMKRFAFFDGRNQFKMKEMKDKGFDYFAIGIPDH
jgi:UDPglucose 6-dehydrogenase